jgi:hypothetical protein
MLCRERGGQHLWAERPATRGRVCGASTAVYSHATFRLGAVSARPETSGSPTRRAAEHRAGEAAARPSQPFPDASFELVTSRHPVAPDWSELARVLVDGGTYFAQHVGPDSAFELIEYFVGPLPREHQARDPEHESAAARRAGFEIVDLRMARCRMEFADIGAIVYVLRKCVWWVPDFTVERYRGRLRELDARIRRDGRFVAHSTRTLIEARRVSRRRRVRKVLTDRSQHRREGRPGRAGGV